MCHINQQWMNFLSHKAHSLKHRHHAKLTEALKNNSWLKWLSHINEYVGEVIDFWLCFLVTIYRIGSKNVFGFVR